MTEKLLTGVKIIRSGDITIIQSEELPEEIINDETGEIEDIIHMYQIGDTIHASKEAFNEIINSMGKGDVE